jgi:hypothetical protein
VSLVLSTVLGVALGSLLFAQPSDSPDDQLTLNGLVTLNGTVAPPGIHVTVERAGEVEIQCGDFVTGQDAAFELILARECGRGRVVDFVLDTGDRSSTQVTIPSAEPVEVEFDQLSSTVLQALGVEETVSTEPPPVIESPSAPLSGWDLYVVVFVVVLPAAILLLLMVMSEGRGLAKGGMSDKQTFDFRPQIEGMVLVMVVLAVILLGVTDKIGSDGLISVLAAIVGYTVGRQITSEGQTSGETSKGRTSGETTEGQTSGESAAGK